MKNFILTLFIFITIYSINSIENDFFIKLSNKELATFNDAITLMRLLYDEEEDYDADFINNVLWAAGKKLFIVTIPIDPNTINPIITKREFSYWIAKIFNIKNGIVNTEKLTRYKAYRVCVNKKIIKTGRGPFDSFTGRELLETFSYLDYFIRYNKIKTKEGELEIYDDTYKDMPEWRQKIYRELDEQRKKEKELRKLRIEKRKEKLKKEKPFLKNKDSEKFIDKEKATE